MNRSRPTTYSIAMILFIVVLATTAFMAGLWPSADVAMATPADLDLSVERLAQSDIYR